MVTASRDDKSITRNTSFFKKIPQREDPQVIHEPARIEVPNHGDEPSVESQATPPTPPVLKPALKSPEIRRSMRERKAPVRFKDFV